MESDCRNPFMAKCLSRLTHFPRGEIITNDGKPVIITAKYIELDKDFIDILDHKHWFSCYLSSFENFYYKGYADDRVKYFEIFHSISRNRRKQGRNKDRILNSSMRKHSYERDELLSMEWLDIDMFNVQTVIQATCIEPRIKDRTTTSYAVKNYIRRKCFDPLEWLHLDVSALPDIVPASPYDKIQGTDGRIFWPELYYNSSRYFQQSCTQKEAWLQMDYRYPTQKRRRTNTITHVFSNPLEELLILLQKFVKSEKVSDIKCDSCAVTILEYLDVIDNSAIANSVLRITSLLQIPTTLPIKFVVHYLTCQEPTCSIEPAFTLSEILVGTTYSWNELQFNLRKDIIPCINTFLFFDERRFHRNVPLTAFHYPPQEEKLSLQYIVKTEEECRNHPESSQAKELVQALMETLLQCLRKKAGWDDVRIKLAGSAEEGSRPYFPDEFDYVLIFKEKHLGKCNHVSEETEDPDCIQLCKNCIEQKIYIPIFTTLSEFENEYKNMESFLRFGTTLKLGPNNYFALNLKWYGKFFKEMDICVDLVPVLNANSFEIDQLPKHNLVDFKQFSSMMRTTLSVMYNCKTDFSELEVAFIKSLPENIRKGYTLAKVIRLRNVLPETLLEYISKWNHSHEGVHSIVKSYMLKTCLLFITQDLEPNHESIGYSCVYWATRIFGELLKRVLQGEIRSFFDEDSESVFNCTWELEEDEDEYGYPRSVIRADFDGLDYEYHDALLILAFTGSALKFLRTYNSEENLRIVRDDFLEKVKSLMSDNSEDREFAIQYLRSSVYHEWL